MFNTALNNGAAEKIGSVKAWGGSTAPSGWLFCDGSAISRTTYAALFAVIGTTYGTGNGTTTFNLPNFGGFSRDIPVIGTGKSLGLSDGTHNGGMIYNSGLSERPTALNANIATSGASGSKNFSDNAIIGVITNTNSGLVGKTTAASERAKAIIKY